MQPDDKVKEQGSPDTEKEVEKTTEKKTEDVNAESLIDAKLDKLMADFNNKIDEITKKHTEEVEKLKAENEEKAKEIDKLRTVNKEILMNTSVGEDKKGEVDFSSTDFEDIDWVPQCDDYLKALDKKVFQ